MNQQQLWDKKWSKITELLPPTDFAKKSFSLIKNNNFRTLLDRGCGDGKDSIYFAQKGLSVTAVDFSSKAIEILKSECKKRNIISIKPVIADIEKIDFDLNSFDIIFANLSLHYFSDESTTSIFTNLYKILKTGGYLFINCKSVHDSLFGQGKKIEKDFFIIDDKPIHLFSIDYLKDKLSKFKVISLKETSSDLKTMEKGVVKSFFTEGVAKKI